MLNPILILCHNNLHLSRRAIASAKAQDIGDIQILAMNNGSNDGTARWLEAQKDLLVAHYQRKSVAECWNRGITFCFERLESNYVLVINNDVELPPHCYQVLLSSGLDFVTGVGQSRILDGRDSERHSRTRSPHPDFACFLIQRSTWNTVGLFDENFKIAYAEDNDYHCRMHQAGIDAYALDMPYLHHGSQVLKNSTLPEIRRIQAQAEKNREYFFEKWGFRIASPEYDAFLQKPVGV
jgi:GT2 family glycosyltransferase